MVFVDAHFHLCNCTSLYADSESACFTGCTCSLNPEDFEKTANSGDLRFVQAYGIHPLAEDISSVDFEETLLEQKKIQAVGEIGFDFFRKEYRVLEARQLDLFQCQLELALKYNVPVVIHNRKGFSFLYQSAPLLSKLPAVLFHGFSGGLYEANSILCKNINAYFSFGKTLLRGSPKTAECVEKLPEDRILFETDAPFMCRKGEVSQLPQDLLEIYSEACQVKGCHIEWLCETVLRNFKNCFGLS